MLQKRGNGVAKQPVIAYIHRKKSYNQTCYMAPEGIRVYSQRVDLRVLKIAK